ncbi:sensor histidine kinase N-terminal domain-containing protein [Neisseriaceae bacterium JH1-16]|nr:sensor histidine kinase N-terminal domain-containing protein [Neisseriaceae bacterium JH1-16]
MASRSLRARLMLWLLAPLALVMAVQVGFAYRDGLDTAQVVHDRLLLGAARIIAEQMNREDDLSQVYVPPAALELFQSRVHDRVFYRVQTHAGRLLLGYPELPLPKVLPQGDEPVYFDAQFRGLPVRAVALSLPLFGRPEGPLLIEVAETGRARHVLSDQLWEHLAQQQALLLLLAGALVWVGLTHGLGPIRRLRAKVEQRTPGSLEPLPTDEVPGELRPLVDAMNDYAGRLDHQIAARGRFIANSAHQLRTPLALLATQVNYGLRATDPAVKDEVLRAIEAGVRDNTRLVNQLLTLAMAESRGSVPGVMAPHDLAQTVREVLETWATLAEAKSIDLGLEQQVDAAPVALGPRLLHELVANLVDNAVRYTQAGGVVTVRVGHRDGAVSLEVEDDGPGIAHEERGKVFERFYRVLGSESEGSGLGLSIVHEIAQVSDATVRLDDGPGGRGLKVSVVFPAS